MLVTFLNFIDRNSYVHHAHILFSGTVYLSSYMGLCEAVLLPTDLFVICHVCCESFNVVVAELFDLCVIL